MRRLIAILLMAAASAAGAQDYRLPSAARIAQYQDRFANVYKASGYTNDEAVEAMQAYFGTDYDGVEFSTEQRSTGDLDFVVLMRRDGVLVFYHVYATVAP